MCPPSFMSNQPPLAGPSAIPHPLPPPTLISIGSFLIDAFDTPPRPAIDKPPISHHPAYTPRATPPAPPSSASPTHVHHPNSRLVHTPPAHHPSSPLSPAPSISNPHGSSSTIPPSPTTHSQSHLPPIESIESIEPLVESGKLNEKRKSGSSTPQQGFDDQPPPKHPFEYLGGGALYALVGARMFLPSNTLRTLVDCAPGKTDIPSDLKDQADLFGRDMWVWNQGPKTRMPRARIRYDGEKRLYHYHVKAPQRTISQLLSTPLYGAEYMHISPPYSALDVVSIQHDLENLGGSWKPKLLFEPHPPSCHEGQRGWLEKVAKGLYVLSPNHEELLSFYGKPQIPVDSPKLVPTVEGIMIHLLHEIGIGPEGDGIVMVRCGRLGGCVGTKKGGLKWFPAFHGGEREHLVKDVTGAGNSFLGGFVAGLKLSNGDPYQAALYGTVAASFTVEQICLPTIEPGGSNSGQSTSSQRKHQEERWNGEIPSERVEGLKRKWASEGLLDIPTSTI